MVTYAPTEIDAWRTEPLPKAGRGQTVGLSAALAQRLEARSALLAREVVRSPGFEGWKSDLSVASLAQLGAWLTDCAQRSPGMSLDPPADLVSKACDVGGYLGNVWVTQRADVAHWGTLVKPADSLEIGLPVVDFGRSGAYVNPMRLVLNNVRNVLCGRSRTVDLETLYSLWCDEV